ncbi:MAG: hypothetical protein WBD47_19620 [Phormidesmis sp.]
MSNFSAFNTEAPSLSLLALKRFVNGTLRQIGIGVVSLILVLNISTYLSQPAPQSEFSPQLSSEQASQTADTLPADESPLQTPHSKASHLQPSHSQVFPFSDSHVVSASLTHHHLTGARLSIPPQKERPMVSLADAE